jgi:hypothetical protein
MELEEGQIYEGSLSISGGDGPFRRWLVVSPFGKTHIHCIDDPLDLHCWPASLIEPGIESGRLRYVGTDREHPGVRVQRLKETLGVRDVHLSIDERQLKRLLEALRSAVADDADYAPYLAGEILSAVARSAALLDRHPAISATVHAILAGQEHPGLASAQLAGSADSAAPPLS